MADSIGLTPSSEDSGASSGIVRVFNETLSMGSGFTTQIQSGYGALISAIEGNGTFLYNATVVCGPGKSAKALMSGDSVGIVYLNVSVSQLGSVYVRFTSQTIPDLDSPVIAIIPLAPI